MPVQVPGLAVSVSPSAASPSTLGGSVLTGGAAAIGAAVGAEASVVEPPALVAVTSTTTAWPTSPGTGE